MGAVARQRDGQNRAGVPKWCDRAVRAGGSGSVAGIVQVRLCWHRSGREIRFTL